MRWLLLILMIACGKHQVPKAVDFHDSDGDQIQNYLESNPNRYIADFTPLGEMTGEFSFRAGQGAKKEFTLKLTNTRNIFNDSLEMLTQAESVKRNENFFDEWSKLRFDSPIEIPEMQDRMHSVKLTFSASNARPQTLIMVKEGQIKNLGVWKSHMTFDLTYEELLSLLNKDAFLALSKKVMVLPYYDSQPIDVTIRERTYRVFMNDGKEAKIFYVAKDFSFKRFLESLKINETHLLDEKEHLFFNESNIELWWVRNLNDGDKVLAYASSQTLKTFYLKGFYQHQILLNKENGSPKNSITLTKKSNARLYLKLRPQQTLRTFNETIETKKYRSGGGGREGTPESWKCLEFYRVMATETVAVPDFENLLSSLVLTTDESSFVFTELNTEVMLKEDQAGPYYQVFVPVTFENFRISLKQSSPDTFVTAGRYAIKCDRGHEVRGKVSTVPSNIEGKFVLNLEAYVEKLD